MLHLVHFILGLVSYLSKWPLNLNLFSSIVTLVPEDQTERFIKNVIDDYFQDCQTAKDLNPTTYIFPTSPGQGAAIYNSI